MQRRQRTMIKMSICCTHNNRDPTKQRKCTFGAADRRRIHCAQKKKKQTRLNINTTVLFLSTIVCFFFVLIAFSLPASFLFLLSVRLSHIDALCDHIIYYFICRYSKQLHTIHFNTNAYAPHTHTHTHRHHIHNRRPDRQTYTCIYLPKCCLTPI